MSRDILSVAAVTPRERAPRGTVKETSKMALIWVALIALAWFGGKYGEQIDKGVAAAQQRTGAGDQQS